MKKASLGKLLKWDIILIITVFLCAFVIPVFPPSWGKAPARIGFTMIFLSGVMTMEKRNIRILYLAFAAFAMEWVSQIFDLELIADISRFLNIVFFFVVIANLFREMATAKVVTPQVIMSSITGYLILGIIYSLVVAAIIQRDADAFNIPRAANEASYASAHLSESIYFGFVTLASLGYGDILPLKPYSRSLATLITISGQLYIATVIGMLIGKFVSGTDTNQNRK